MAHAYTSSVIDLPAGRTPTLLKVLRTHDPDYVPLDGTLLADLPQIPLQPRSIDVHRQGHPHLESDC